MTADLPLARYYARRAGEYERIYTKPERQDDLRQLEDWVADFGRDQRVLELACGTGWWTAVLAPVAKAVTAVDVNPEVLEVARAKSLPGVEWCCRDVYASEPIPGLFTAGMAGFWWSHVPRRKLPGFLVMVHRQLEPGARVLFLDNRYVSGSSTPISRTDSDGNTYQTRTLADGTEHEVLKNFPTSQELTALLSPLADQLRVRELTHYWCVDYRVGQRAGGQLS